MGIQLHNNSDFGKNRAFLYGDGIFETVKTIGQHPVFWPAHAARMLAGMDVLGLNYDETSFLKSMETGIRTALQNLPPDTFGRLRITVFRGGAGAYTPESNAPEVVLQYRSYSPKSPENLEIGIFRKIHLQENPLSKIKSLNALPYVLAGKFASENGWDDAVLVSGDYISETSRSNIFTRFGDQVFTPALAQGCLPGVIRGYVIKWLENEGMKLTSGPIAADSLSAANEILLTNSIRGIQAVTRLDQKNFPGKAGPLYQKLAALLEKAERESALHFENA